MVVLSDTEWAWAAGYALCDHPDAYPATARPTAGRHLAETGRKAAFTTALHRSRMRLYSNQRAHVLRAARPYLAQVKAGDLLTVLALLAAHDRPTRQAQAVTTITGAVHRHGPPAAWDDANTAAHNATAARGWAEADAAPSAGGPADPHHVDHVLPAAAAATAIAMAGGSDWTRQQISRLAWQLSPDKILAGSNPELSIAQVLADPTAVGDSAEDLMHGTYGSAFVAWFNTGDGTSLGQIEWVTAEDDRVCDICDDNESGGPYPPDGVPDFPAHPLCRCSLELA